MKSHRFVAIALAAAGFIGAMGIERANAVLVSIGLDDGPGGLPITTVATGLNVAASTPPGTVFNGFSVNVTAAGNPPLPTPAVLGSNQLLSKMQGLAREFWMFM